MNARTSIMCALALSSVLLSATQSSDHANRYAPAPTTITQNEPMVIYSVTGGTLTGGVHRQLTVYNNGFATIAKLDTPVFPTPGTFKDVETTSVGATAALQLLIDLVNAGAATLPEQQFILPDVPLTTLTVLEGREIGLSRTISFSGGPPYSAMQQVIDRFVNATFPGF